jgi:trafficking protein particle complex subunit 13
MKADLQTSSQRLTLSGSNPQTSNELAPDDSIDDVIHHEVKELGTHMYVTAAVLLNHYIYLCDYF